MKKLTYIKVIIICIISFFSLSVNAQKLNKFVTDEANIIPDTEQTILENKLASFEASTTNQIVVLTMAELPQNETIESLANKIFNENVIGQKGKNNGLLFLIALKDRKNRFETGYGLEPILPDVYTARLQRDIIAPAFRNGDYIGGINSSLDQIMARINKGEPYTDNTINNTNNNYNSLSTQPLTDGHFVFIVLGSLLIFFRIVIIIFSKTKSFWAGGVLGAFVGIFLYLYTGFLAFLSLILIGLFLDMFFSGGSKVAKAIIKFTRGGRGGAGGGFFGGSSSGGGFSGGGGSSGSW